ncbi:hypothetical protein EV426DRAFT_256459 [Tirmania nivea]|nr:hypothetical protein EV426DRAFT_256459 [Tirmania nivea]
MAEAPLSNTPRLSEISSVESPRNSFDQASASMLNAGPQTSIPPSYELMGKKPSPRILDETRVRRSPDSEALVSSDDENDHQGLSYFSQAKGLNNLSSRRPSYAAEFQNRSRTYSVLGGGPLSPTTSHPVTPAGDTTAWAAAVSASNASAQPFNLNWGGSIWNTDSRKSPPKPISVRSASISGPSAPSPLFVGSEALPSPTTISTNAPEFPIPIPLQPQLRNYRSMSFSVGQRELEDHTKARLSPPTMLGSRGLQHRPSRPSLLSEEHYAGQSSPLRSVFETEDDEYAAREGNFQQSGEYTSQMPGRQRFMSLGYDTSRYRARSASTTTVPTVSLTTSTGGFFNNRENDRVEEESALIEDEDDFDMGQRRINGRSMSLMHSSAEGQRLDSLRRQHWQSVGGTFGGLGEAGPQSRRHSFAAFAANDGTGDYDLAGTHDNDLNLNSGLGLNGNRDRYFEDTRVRARQSLLGPQAPAVGPSPSTPPNQHHLQPYPTTRISQQPSPPPTGLHRGLLGVHSHAAQQQRSNHLLYLVSFKACRADVFYVQEGTGLRVRKGDLVIVEADRGTDLGTVIHENITWQQARDYKEYYAKEHLQWLMMFATRRVAAAANVAANAPAPVAPNQFANGPGNNQHGQLQMGQDGAASMELKPKMIKRLAQVHEIQTLRDKEANEAKAKRVCQQKVLEHRLPMEILDAEFQMDWKKLTFYYFADCYINFNSLVTDLFKVYKTRIWMSAMNPASFAHPTAGPGTNGDGLNDQPQQFHTQLAGIAPYSQISPNGLVRSSYQSTLPQPHHGPNFTSRGTIGPQGDFGHLTQQQHNGYPTQYMNGVGSGSHQGPLTNGSSAAAMGNSPGNLSVTGIDWAAFQSLSLQSH